MPVRLLLTGFVPFGAHSVNPSERVLRAIADSPPDGVVLSTRVLPVSYQHAFTPVLEALDTETFSSVVMLGLGEGRAAICFERLAINWRGSPEPDNDGVRVTGERIDPAGPAAYFSTLPVDELAALCQTAGAAGLATRDAGSFLCNQVLYQTLRHCDRRDLPCRTGFVHLPLLPEQAPDGRPHMPEDVMITGVRAALARVAELPPTDLPPRGGPTPGEPTRPGEPAGRGEPAGP